LSEYDPVTLDVETWSDYWASLHLDSIVLTAGGFLAFYPTELKWHTRSQHLADRDLLGEYTRALKSRGIRVVARIETNWAHEKVFRERPDWFERDESGKPVFQAETPWVYHICMFSDYHTKQVPAIMREISSRYDIDGFFTNSWPPSGKPYPCHCEVCRRAQDHTARGLYERSRSRILEVCELLIEVAREKKPDCVYNINIGGGLRAAQSHMQLGRMGSWLTADHQGRNGEVPIWDVTQQGRVARAIMGTKPLTNVVGTKSSIWRHSTKSKMELEMWLSGCVASGMVPWYVWLGAEVEDRRWMETGRKFYSWLKKNERHFTNLDSVANVAVLFSQRINAFYDAPGRLNLGYGARGNQRDDRAGKATDHLQGVYLSLLKGRFAFDFVHEENLGADTLGRYDLLVLPNSAVLSDEQCREIGDFVASGGSVVAVFESSLYDEWGVERKDFALAEVLGVHKGADQHREGHTFYTRVNGEHTIVRGFDDTGWIPGGEYRVPLERSKSGDVILTVVPPYPQGVPEMVYPHPREELPYAEDDANEPGLVARECDGSRMVYFAGDVGRAIWLHGNTDLIRLFNRAVRWALKERTPVSVEGEGVVEYFAWRTAAGYAIHILNYTNPNMTHSDFDSIYEIGPQQVRLEIAPGVRIARVELISDGRDIPFVQDGSTVAFQVPSVGAYEVAALHQAAGQGG
jgi:hypothetical protein